MKGSRRLTLQLTPLLDLLLIVIFAQYMEVRIVAKQESDKVAVERNATVTENEDLRHKVDEWERQQRVADQSQWKEREQIGQIVRELFRIPEKQLNKIIQPRSKNEASGLSASEIADLKSQIHQFAGANGEQIIDHLLTFNQMRKQFDIWEIYMDENGALLISIGQDGQRVRSQPISSPEAFVDVILRVRDQFPPTRENVLLLCSYGDCRLLNRLSMTRGLPAISERIRKDGQGSLNFEYAVFGYRPAPDLKSSADENER